jgi:uncharacterized membrane protein HdeD (DUF308 family)
MAATLTRNWGWILLRGVLAILFGVLTFLYPGLTLLTLVFLFGAYALVDGVFLVVTAITNRKGEPRWVALLIAGLLGMAAGVATLFWPGITAAALLAMVAVWAILVGVAEIVAGIRLRREITGEWMLILAGLLAVAFGAFMVARPAAGALAMVLWIGAYAVVSGIVLVVLSLRLRSWGHVHPAV